MNDLNTYLNGLVNFSASEMEILLALFSEKRLGKGEYLAKKGEYSTKLAFITKGVMRAFYRSKDGSEYNKTFFIKPNFVGAYSSLVTGDKSLIYIQCLTDCTLQISNYREITNLYDVYPKVERLARKIAEDKFVKKEKREIELVTLDASERYEIFRMEYPGLENLIPQYHIAYYLGITPTQLSRIRAKK